MLPLFYGLSAWNKDWLDWIADANVAKTLQAYAKYYVYVDT